MILFVVIYSCLKTADLAWALGDLGVGLMAWLNIIGILFLQKPAFAALRDYEAQVKQGKDPIYDARAKWRTQCTNLGMKFKLNTVKNLVNNLTMIALYPNFNM